jgi:hypothetical protein
MFKKPIQISNGGPPTSHKTTNISPSPLTAVYLMEIKPTISDWHELLHNSCSAVDLESILRFYFRSILPGRKLISTVLRYLEWATQNKMNESAGDMIKDQNREPQKLSSLIFVAFPDVMITHYGISTQFIFKAATLIVFRGLQHSWRKHDNVDTGTALDSVSVPPTSTRKHNTPCALSITNGLSLETRVTQPMQFIIMMLTADQHVLFSRHLTISVFLLDNLRKARTMEVELHPKGNLDGHSQQEVMMLEIPHYLPIYPSFHPLIGQHRFVSIERQHKPDLVAGTRGQDHSCRSHQGKCLTSDIAYADDLHFLALCKGGLQCIADTVGSLRLTLGLENEHLISISN